MRKSFLIGTLVITVLAVGWIFSSMKRCADSAEHGSLRVSLLVAENEIARLKQELETKTDRPDPSNQPNHPDPVIPEAAANPLANDVEPLTVTTVRDSNAENPPPMSAETINAIERFDYAMDREFNRLDKREEKSSDSTEVATINVIKEKLVELDALYIRADQATDGEERQAIRKEMQQAMGTIIGLSRQDRNERLSKLATDIGYNDPQAVEAFVREIDRVYRETHMDWTKLFNRTPPAMTPTNPENISPGMLPEDVNTDN